MWVRLAVVLGVLGFMIATVIGCEKVDDEQLEGATEGKSHLPTEEPITEEKLNDELEKMQKEIKANVAAGR